jgi:pimeloyl-ACP methyl ester carboxylesterase
MRSWAPFPVAVLLLVGGGATQAIERKGPAICFGESFYFASLRGQAGKPAPNRVKNIRGATQTELTMSDGATIRGFQLKVPTPIGFVLYAPGNGMLADQIVSFLAELSDNSYNIYVYDWRGLGMSPGKTSLRDIFADYQEIIRSVTSREHGQRVFYGVSFGGVALLNALSSNTKFG